MIRHLATRPVLYTALGTLFSVTASVAITAAAMKLAGLPPLLPVATLLSILLPATVTPVVMVPLILSNRRERGLRTELERLVLTDMLTELPNRRAFFEFTQGVIDAPAPVGGRLTAMMIDVDHFKLVNDTYGHDVGDAVLKRIAGVIRAEVEAAGAPRSTVARLGGEEFVVLVDGLVPTAIARLAERLCHQVHRSVGAGEALLPVTVSIGVAFRAHGMKIDQLLKAADDAVYAAKRAGRDRWAFAGEREASSTTPVRRIVPRPMPRPANDRFAAN
jgi:diguanylate cyclase (GGDEF)-like protein